VSLVPSEADTLVQGQCLLVPGYDVQVYQGDVLPEVVDTEADSRLLLSNPYHPELLKLSNEDMIYKPVIPNEVRNLRA